MGSICKRREWHPSKGDQPGGESRLPKVYAISNVTPPLNDSHPLIWILSIPALESPEFARPHRSNPDCWAKKAPEVLHVAILDVQIGNLGT